MTPNIISGQYNLRAVQCTVGNYLISDLGEGGITTESPSERIGDSVSADGRAHFHVIHDDRVYVTISVMASSQAAAVLFTLAEAQRQAQRAGLATPPLLFSLFDPLLGDSLNDSYAVFKVVPTPSKTVEEGTLDFQLLLPNGRAGMKIGGAQVTPQIPAPGTPSPIYGP